MLQKEAIMHQEASILRSPQFININCILESILIHTAQDQALEHDLVLVAFYSSPNVLKQPIIARGGLYRSSSEYHTKSGAIVDCIYGFPVGNFFSIGLPQV